MLKLSSYDVFRKLPRDLTHGTAQGGVLSVFAIALIFVVFIFELWTYLAGEVETAVMLDTNSEELLQINFRITALRLPCEFTSVDVWDYLGNNRLDLTKDIHKTMVAGPNGDKILGAYSDGNLFPSGSTTDEVRAQIGLNESEEIFQSNFKEKLRENHWSFVDFFAPWCIHWYAFHSLFFFFRFANACTNCLCNCDRSIRPRKRLLRLWLSDPYIFCFVCVTTLIPNVRFVQITAVKFIENKAYDSRQRGKRLQRQYTTRIFV